MSLFFLSLGSLSDHFLLIDFEKFSCFFTVLLDNPLVVGYHRDSLYQHVVFNAFYKRFDRAVFEIIKRLSRTFSLFHFNLS
jgi:hypothetical protein